jgi:hypothetical protein
MARRILVFTGKASPLKALGSVAYYLANAIFYLSNDKAALLLTHIVS